VKVGGFLFDVESRTRKKGEGVRRRGFIRRGSKTSRRGRKRETNLPVVGESDGSEDGTHVAVKSRRKHNKTVASAFLFVSRPSSPLLPITNEETKSSTHLTTPKSIPLSETSSVGTESFSILSASRPT